MNGNEPLENIDIFVNTGIQYFNTQLSDAALQDLDIDPIELAQWLAGDWQETNVSFARAHAIRRGNNLNISIAIDTSTGFRSAGCIGALDDIRDYRKNKPIVISIKSPGKQTTCYLSICRVKFIDADTYGDNIPLTLVLDIGNSRTSALVIEDSMSNSPLTVNNFFPVSLLSYLQPFSEPEDIFSSTLEFIPPRWTQNKPLYRPKVIKRDDIFSRLLRLFTYVPLVDIFLTADSSKVFKNDSLISIGADASEWRVFTESVDPESTGLSSPKRYLWANKPSDTIWCYGYYDKKHDKCDARKIHGSLLKYFSNNDEDKWIDDDEPKAYAVTNPEEPRYPKRTMMAFFIYEALKAAYTQVNSISHRIQTTSPRRKRVLQNIVLTYPSGMIGEELNRFQIQAKKAIKIFQMNYPGNRKGKEKNDISIYCKWDEGVASQICFAEAFLTRCNGSINEVLRSLGLEEEDELKIASLDVGGGTIDVAVVKYTKGKKHGVILGRVKAIDGVNFGGDDLMRELINEFIWPQIIELVQASGEDPSRITSLFTRAPIGYKRSLQIRVLREFLIPLSLKLLDTVLDEKIDIEEVSVSRGVDEKVLEDAKDLFGMSKVSEIESWKLRYSRAEILSILEAKIRPMLTGLVRGIIPFDPHVIVLAGRVSRLPTIKKIVSEIMEDKKGVILAFHEDADVNQIHQKVFGRDGVADPKVSVVLGGALAYCGDIGRASAGRRFKLDYSNVSKKFYWGFLDASTSRFDIGRELLFVPEGNKEAYSLELDPGIYFIGRHNINHVDKVARLRYRLEVKEKGAVTIRRQWDGEFGEEVLVLDYGEVSERASLFNQSSIESVYWLDSGIL